jgi:hypothetical protein
MTPPKLNSTDADTNDTEVDTVPEKGLKIVIRMIDEIKEDMNKYLNKMAVITIFQ